MSLEPLFEPFQVNKLTLRNRFVMPPMQRGFVDNGAPTQDVVDLYRRSARGGVGLVIGESTAPPHPSGFWMPECCRLDHDTVDAWRRVIDATHDGGAHFFFQIWHPGAVRIVPEDWPEAAQPSLSPSGLIKKGRPNGREMTGTELEEIGDSYKRAAEIALACGADGLEFHGAHGYLLDQFLWAETNLRTDGYGGSLAARARFPCEVVRAVREVVGPEMPLSFRLSQFKEADFDARICETPDQLGELLGLLKDAGVDIFHMSARRFYQPAWPESPLTLAGWAKQLSGLPVIAVGSVGLSTDLFDNLFDKREPELEVQATLDRLAAMFDRGEFDLVSVGRALIADPEWVEKVREDRLDEIKPFSRALLGERNVEIVENMGEEMRQ